MGIKNRLPNISLISKIKQFLQMLYKNHHFKHGKDLFYVWQRFTFHETWDMRKEKCLITWYPGTQRKLGTPSIGLGSFWILSKWSAIKAAVCMSVILFFCNIVQKGLKVFTHSLFEILNSPRCCGAFPCFPATKASNFPLSLIFS